MNFTNIINLLGTKNMGSEVYSLYLNEVRKNLAAPGKLLLSSPKGAYCWCSTTYVPVGDLDRPPLIKEPLSNSYGDLWLPARFGIKARLCRHAVACQEVAPKVGALATQSPYCAESPVGRTVKHASAASPKAPTLVQPSPRAKAISFALRLASTCFRTRRDPIGLVQRFPGYGYASAGDRPTLFAIFPLIFVPFMQYTG